MFKNLGGKTATKIISANIHAVTNQVSMLKEYENTNRFHLSNIKMIITECQEN